MSQLIKRAAILWTAGAVEHVYLLRVPLQKVMPAASQRTYAMDSLDHTQREVVTVGSPAYEMAGRVRYDEDPQTFLDMLLAGQRGVVLTYVPDMDDPPEYPCWLVEPAAGEHITLEPDVDWEYVTEHTKSIRLRRTTTGSPFA